MKKYLRAEIHTLLVLKQWTPWGHGICNSLDELILPTHAGAMDNFRQAGSWRKSWDIKDPQCHLLWNRREAVLTTLVEYLTRNEGVFLSQFWLLRQEFKSKPNIIKILSLKPWSLNFLYEDPRLGGPLCACELTNMWEKTIHSYGI